MSHFTSLARAVQCVLYLETCTAGQFGGFLDSFLGQFRPLRRGTDPLPLAKVEGCTDL